MTLKVIFSEILILYDEKEEGDEKKTLKNDLKKWP